MAHRHLRVYHGPVTETATVSEARVAPQTVTVPLGDVLHLLADAVASESHPGSAIS